MNFEEFFTKKKIDLQKLMQADASLYAKIQKEYAEMGAKSFDHYYKFLFNKWRRDYSI